MINDADISGVLKRVYEKFRINTFPIATPLMAALKRAKKGGPQRIRWGGEGLFWDVMLSRPTGMTASSDGRFPDSQKVVEKQASVGICRLYISRQIDGLAAMGTESREAAFISLARKIVQEALQAAKLGQQEVLHGAGDGIKGLITVVNSTTDVDVSSPFGVAGAGQGGLLVDVGMQLAVLDTSAANAVLGRLQVLTAVNTGDTVRITWTGAIAGMAVGDKIVACTTGDTAFGAAGSVTPNGLMNLLNRGGSYPAVHGLSSATAGQARWDTTRLVAGTDTADAARPDEMDVWELGSRIAGRSGHDPKLNPDEFLMLSTPGIEKKLAESFFGQRRFDASSFMTIRGGFKAVNICGIPLVADYWTPAGTLYMLHLNDLAWVDARDWQQVQFEGAGPWRWVPGRDAFELNWGTYMNTAVLNRVSHGMITGYTDAQRYSHVM
jgi:hypothetical protein